MMSSESISATSSNGNVVEARNRARWRLELVFYQPRQCVWVTVAYETRRRTIANRLLKVPVIESAAGSTAGGESGFKPG